ncbi:hypothetical protein [Amaricoccus solimangrovi]|uniref:Uncharacterized protein n=1 Tax=Amaricoccus solimangrovi TaxID=2589815 RepID=A0A501WW39_9RHOB|nr:hypothetical protein [Amaricoccus solimangrovi]TPE52650.1 hypothetical protein FJM51_05595 [Amaricoccus solimangrovi]
MNAHRTPGAAPVARLAELPPLERRVVLYARLWSAGRLGQAEVWKDLIERHGPAGATCAAGHLDALLRETLAFARRPLQCHAPSCPCAGGDECVLARFVALAAEGAREDAILMATLMVRPDMSLILAAIAEDLGLLLMRGIAAAPPVSRTRH